MRVRLHILQKEVKIITMGISTTGKRSLTKEERVKKVAELREYHQEYFDLIGDTKARFAAKMRFGYPPDRSKFFAKEIGGSNPLYVEWVSRQYEPEDDRRLYRFDPEPDYETIFEKEVSEEGYEWYIVPVERFTLVKDGQHKGGSIVEPVQSALDLDFDIVNPDEDCAMDNITLRDWAAILLKTPVSRKEWLNKIIKETCQK